MSLTGRQSVSAAPAAGAAGQIGTTQFGTPAPAAGIASVAADTSTITVSGSLPSTYGPAATALDIYELDPTQDPSAYASGAPVARIAAPSTAAFRATFPRFAGTRDRYLDAILIGSGVKFGIDDQSGRCRCGPDGFDDDFV